MNIKKYLYPFITDKQLCPFCQITLVKREGYAIKYCPRFETKDNPYCPYFFEIKALHQQECYDTIEITLNKVPCRVWIKNWKLSNAFKIIKIGEHQHITCVLLPLEKANLQDMDKFVNKIKTILTFQ
jgi:hypothetical protein